MYIVTGGAGFIGSNIIKALNARGIDNILVVDDLTDGRKCLNIAGLKFRDYQDKDEFVKFMKDDLDFFNYDVKAVFHQGAISSTTEWNGKHVMTENFTFSRNLLHWCYGRDVPFYYASSASVYGNGKTFAEIPENESPLNPYAVSKLTFDNYVRAFLADNKPMHPVVGLRYFNVYGPQESHKASMASVAYHLFNQMWNTNEVNLFKGCDGYDDGEQMRDFIHVDDVVAINMWMLDNPQVSGIFNVGTGHARTFNDLAATVLDSFNTEGKINYIQFPPFLTRAYQCFTQADLQSLREAGCKHEFMSLEDGVASYMEWMHQQVCS